LLDVKPADEQAQEKSEDSGRRIFLRDVQHFDPDFLAAAANLRDVHGMSQHG
jgi:hypothetical protein